MIRIRCYGRLDKNVDCVAIQLLVSEWAAPEDLPESFSRAAKIGKPIATWIAATSEKASAIIEKLEAQHIPVFESAETAIKMLSALHKYKTMQNE